LVAERRQRITVAESGNFRELLRALAIEVDSLHPERVWGENLALARLYGLSVYDASYLELAIRRRLPLATLDGKLKAAARAAQVEIVS
jgi:predicted nucleic acid-binding protein